MGRDRLSGRVVYTRRMRRVGKGDGMYVRSWEDWERVCAVGGVPVGWLSREMVGLMRLGLPRDGDGELIGEFDSVLQLIFFFPSGMRNDAFAKVEGS